MSETLKIALITASAALFGSVVGILGGLILDWRKATRDRKNLLRLERRQGYEQFIQSMQTLINRTDSEAAVLDFQKAVNIVLIIGSKSVCQQANSYYKSLISNYNVGKPVSSEEHAKFQADIINTIRKDILGEDNSIQDISLVAFKENYIRPATRPRVNKDRGLEGIKHNETSI